MTLHDLRHAIWILSLMMLPAKAYKLPWDFLEVTAQVVDENPPGIGPVFDYAFLDLNDDNCLDIVVNNHQQSKPSPKPGKQMLSSDTEGGHPRLHFG